MLLSLASWLQTLGPEFGWLRVVQYITFRAVLAAMTSLLIGIVAGPWVIRRLTELKIGQPVRGYAMQSHLQKRGTPTMGGVLVLISIAVSTLLWFDLTNRFVWIVLVVTLGFGAIGWADDWRKVVNKDPEGMPSREKYFWQSLIGLLAALYLVFSISESNNYRVLELFFKWVGSGFDVNLPPKAGLMLPFFKEVTHPAGRVRLHDHDLPGDRRREQRGEPHRRPRRPGDHAGGDGGFGAGRVRLCHRQAARCIRSTCCSPTSPGSGELSSSSAPRSRGRAWPSSGSTRIRRRCSWATSARWRWAARSAPSP